MARLRFAVMAAVFAAAWVTVAAQGSVTPTSHDHCDELVRQHPGELDVYRCYSVIARQTGDYLGAEQRLQNILSVQTGNAAAKMALANLLLDRARVEDADRVRTLLGEAAETFAGSGNQSGEVLTRMSLSWFLENIGEDEQAATELDLAASAAEGNPALEIRVQTRRADRAFKLDDVSGALALYQDLEARIFPDGPFDLQNRVLNGLGRCSWAMGRVQDSLGYFRRNAERYRKQGDLYSWSAEMHNVAILASKVHRRRVRDDPSELEGILLESLNAARQAGNWTVAGGTLRSLSELYSRRDPHKAMEYGRQGLDLAERHGDFGGRLHGLRILARLEARTGSPEKAIELADLAIELAASRRNLTHLARGYIIRASVNGILERPQPQLEDLFRAMDSIEQVRDLQQDDLVRARSFSNWAFVYYRASGALLDAFEGNPGDEELELAFGIAERMRARRLLDTLDGAQVAFPATDESVEQRIQREEVLQQISGVQSRLIPASVPVEERRRLLTELERLEASERLLRHEIAEADPWFAALRTPEIPDLEQVRSLLEPDQAILAYQFTGFDAFSGNTNGGSWVVLITRDEVRALPQLDEVTLASRVDLFVGLLGRRDGEELEASARLYRDLLEEPLSRLPAEVKRLIVVPDRALHRLPLAALRPSPGEDPLALRYEITRVPSVSAWASWQQGRPESRTGPALALADPEIAEGGDGSAALRYGSLSSGMELGRLPHARDEARWFARYLGGASEVRLGAEASERFLKEADLARFRVLHLAAHAVVDHEHPSRTAVVLSPGAPEEDGLLQIREVVDLDLDGRIVVISACSSAGGTVLAGEGVLGLARAFFQAGARAVVGSLWPLRDDEAASLVRDFSRHLGEGQSVGAALAQAREDRIAAGDPAAGWAGLVLIGDAEAVPVPGGRSAFSPVFAALVAAALLLVGLAVLVGRRTV